MISCLIQFRDEVRQSSNIDQGVIGSTQKIDILELKQIIKWQKADKEISQIREMVNLKENDSHMYCIKDDILYYWRRIDKSWKLVIPYELRKKLIVEIHENMGHIGAYRTYAEISRTYYWSGIQRDVKKVVLVCDLCQWVKVSNQVMEGQYMHVTSNCPNELLCVDFFGPLPRSTGGVQYIFVILDAFSRFVTLYSMKRATTQVSIIKLQKYFAQHGTPQRVLSDHGTQFTSPKWNSFLNENGVGMTLCSIRHPQSNPAERVMRELGRFFRTYCDDQHTRWARYINKIAEWINAAVNCTTGYSPVELHYGVQRKDKIRELLSFPLEVEEAAEIEIEIARERIEKACQKRRQNQGKFNDVLIRESDLVLLRIRYKSDKEDRVIAKFFHIYHGLYTVIRVVNANAFELSEKNNPEKYKGTYNRIDLKIYKK